MIKKDIPEKVDLSHVESSCAKILENSIITEEIARSRALGMEMIFAH